MYYNYITTIGFPGGSVGKNLTASAGDTRDSGSVPGWRRSLGGRHGNPLQYSCLGNSMDRETWWAPVHRVVKSQTRLSDFYLHERTEVYCRALYCLNSFSAQNNPRKCWDYYYLIFNLNKLRPKSRKSTITMTLYARQQKRHRCMEQSFGLCGRRQGWDELRE